MEPTQPENDHGSEIWAADHPKTIHSVNYGFIITYILWALWKSPDRNINFYSKSQFEKHNSPDKIKSKMIGKLLHLDENTSIFLSFNTSFITYMICGIHESIM